MFSELAPTTPSAQTWAAIATAVAGAAAVFLKKRYNNRTRPRPPIENQKSKIKNDYVTRPEFHMALDAITTKLDVNQADVLTALGNQSLIIEQRLDRLDVIVARL